MCIETILYVGIEGAAIGMVGSSGLQESTLEEAELTLAADSIIKGSRDVTIRRSCQLRLAIPKTFTIVSKHIRINITTVIAKLFERTPTTIHLELTNDGGVINFCFYLAIERILLPCIFYILYFFHLNWSCLILTRSNRIFVDK